MTEKQKSPISIYIFLFILIVTIISWDAVGWMFNYRVMHQLAYDFFYPYPDSPYLVSASEIKINQAPVQVASQTSVKPVQAPVPVNTPAPTPTPAPIAPAPVKPANFQATAKTNSLEIPALKLQAPLVIAKSTQIASLERDLDKGVVYYPGSVMPGENGQIAILGHSAPPNWPKIKHDWVFSEISKLKAGDEIILYFNNKKYTYKIFHTAIVNKGEEVGTAGLTGNNNILTIISCWPPGKNYQRIAVSAELQT